MIEQVIEITEKYLNSQTKRERKKIGQFFTSKETAVFMANLSNCNKEKMKILDPGAGTGILTIALLDKLNKENKIKEIEIDLYENDEKIISILEQNMRYASENSKKIIKYNIINKNFIIDNEKNMGNEKYDIVISNPPYKKLGKNDVESLIMSNVIHGQPNMYFLFMTMAVNLLKTGGEIIFIIPRSWTSGAYFKEFRKFFLDNVRLTTMHLFVSRNKVFDKEKVLQETMILRAIKTQEIKEKIEITQSYSNKDFDKIDSFNIPYDLCVEKNNDRYVYLPLDNEDINVIETVKKFNTRLNDIGLKCKTGLTVDFRNEQFLEKHKSKDNAPLLSPMHFKDGYINFPNICEEKQYIQNQNTSLLQKNTNYLLIKRFSSKEEKRRIQSAMFFKEDFKEYDYISTENHINFIGSINNKELNSTLTYGLYALYNSTLYDKYYRILNGSTQVNATEINNIPIPNIEIIEKIGKKLQQSNEISTEICDSILMEAIYMDKLREAKEILKEIGMPKSQQSDLCAYTLLALLQLTQSGKWTSVTNEYIRIHDIMEFIKKEYNISYAENSRETFRKKALHHFRIAAIIEDNNMPTNSPNYRYRITEETLDLIKKYMTTEWEKAKRDYFSNHESLISFYENKRRLTKMPIKINGKNFEFSTGKHNELQKAIIEEFAPRFAPNGIVLYVGDTKDKNLYKDETLLKDLNIEIGEHEKLPDVILYQKEKQWIYFIEAVTSVGPISPKRITEISNITKKCELGKIFITAFIDMKTFKKFAEDLAWETEVWLSEMPDHMIHLNGDKFVGPR